MNSSLSFIGLFLEGLLSFFTPCVLPIVPLYFGYLFSNNKEGEKLSRVKTFLITVCFTLGISTVFFLAGLGSSALQAFFQTYTVQFELAGGVLLILLGLFSLHVIEIPFLNQEHRFRFQKKENGNTYVQAFLLGFFFSFAWSPCIGPLLASAIVASASASSKALGFAYIGAYTLGFIFMFLLVGLLGEEVLNFLKKKRNVVKVTGILGGMVVVGMGIYMLVQANTNLLALQRRTTSSTTTTEEEEDTEVVQEESASAEPEEEQSFTYEFTLKDGQGNSHSLSDYQGKVVILNFFGTWCYYCNEEMPTLQTIDDTYEDVQVLLIATPNLGEEGDIEYIENFLEEAGYDMTILYDEDYAVTQDFGISGYPTSFIVNKDGTFYDYYFPGYMSEDTWSQVLEEVRG